MTWREGNIANLTHAALWYGYGRCDAASDLGLRPDGMPRSENVATTDAHAFATYYANLVTAHEDGIKFFLPSIQDAWQEYISLNHDGSAQTEETS